MGLSSGAVSIHFTPIHQSVTSAAAFKRLRFNHLHPVLHPCSAENISPHIKVCFFDGLGKKVQLIGQGLNPDRFIADS